MIDAINSPQHDVHAAGFIEAIAMRQTAYKPDPATIMRRTLPYCDCDRRICPVCYPPAQQRQDFMTTEDILALAGKPAVEHRIEIGSGHLLDALAVEIGMRLPRGFGETDHDFREKVKRHLNGWIEWNGDEMGARPVAGHVVVEVMHRDGRTDIQRADTWTECWINDDMPEDIIAYRLHKPEQLPQPDRNQPDIMFIDDADVHEGSGQD